MKVTQKTEINQNRVDLECNILKIIFNKAKSIIKLDACMKFYGETKPLYIQTDTSGVGLEAALLQTRSNISCPRDETPYNSILRPIAFASKSLTSVMYGSAVCVSES